ncbi:hypothetical protein ACFTWD_31675 [Streptomyces sp. NPDC056943]|uniref:hypothetical protein n=1 Tax=Streptomyces sp. NPDC056943 TaxID=3345971 RepID=UPI003633CCC9
MPTQRPGSQVEASAERAVAIWQNNYAPVLTGDHSRAVSLPPEALRPPAEVAAPTGLDTLAALPRLFVDGIGKSTLAAHWTATRPHGRSPIRWITANSPSGVHEGLADLAGALQPALSGARDGSGE